MAEIARLLRRQCPEVCGCRIDKRYDSPYVCIQVDVLLMRRPPDDDLLAPDTDPLRESEILDLIGLDSSQVRFEYVDRRCKIDIYLSDRQRREFNAKYMEPRNRGIGLRLKSAIVEKCKKVKEVTAIHPDFNHYIRISLRTPITQARELEICSALDLDPKDVGFEVTGRNVIVFD